MFAIFCVTVCLSCLEKSKKKWSVWSSAFTMRLELQDSGLTKSEGFTSGDGQARSYQLSHWASISRYFADICLFALVYERLLLVEVVMCCRGC